MSFSFSLFARQREGKERKERENMLPLPTLLRAFNQMDVASRACTLTLAIAAKRCTLAARMSFVFYIFLYKIKNLYIDIKIM